VPQHRRAGTTRTRKGSRLRSSLYVFNYWIK
jgi:hypothetical protein